MNQGVSLQKIYRTFEFAGADQRFMLRLRKLIQSDSPENIYRFLKAYNEKTETDRGIKLARPVLHGFDESGIFTRLVQEAYVAAQLFDAGERMLNSLWSKDWEIKSEK